ncbi:MAG: ATPase [Bacteroidetes bacterium]|jgi:uncharacterized protein YndB with AHSA1/START domain|nr:ATPase [Bacteroidota bacterium]
MAEVNVKTETIINCPVEKVFAFATEPENAPQWYVNIHSAEWKTPKPLAIGSRIAFKAKFLGKELAYTYEIKELVTDRKLVMSTAQGPFPMETTYLFEKEDVTKTRMILINRGVPLGFSKLFAPFMSRAMKKANTKDLALLKQLLEKQSS